MPIEGSEVAGIVILDSQGSKDGLSIRQVHVGGSRIGLHLVRATAVTLQGCQVAGSTTSGIVVEDLVAQFCECHILRSGASGALVLGGRGAQAFASFVACRADPP